MTERAPAPTYDPAYFQRLFDIEQTHAWFRARNELIGELASRVTRNLPDGFRVLEVGCGTGAVLQVLERACHRGHVVGMDSFAEGLHFARRRTTCPLVVGDANRPPFGAEFSVVGLFDVLEHLPDDEGVLRRMSELLIPGGTLLLTMPADPGLWSYFDEASHHVRRYTLAELEAKLARAGFAVVYASPFMSALYPILKTYRRISPLVGCARGAAESDELATRDLRIVPLLNDVLYRLLIRERAAIRRQEQLSVGTSILAVARLPESMSP
jgi:SAM-dependent methyltransferase